MYNVFKSNRPQPDSESEDEISWTVSDDIRVSANPIDKTSRETYRLTTFLRLPELNGSAATMMAAHGYYYDNRIKRIKCFSCGGGVENLSDCDVSGLRNLHRNGCRFANGDDSRNVPIQESSPYDTQTDSATAPMETAMGWQGIQHSSSSSSVDRDFATGSSAIPSVDDLLSCQPSSNLSNGVVVGHSFRRHNGGEGSSSGAQRNGAKIDFKAIFKCLYPVNPSMKSEDVRLQTFLNNMTSWLHSVNCLAVPKQFAAAGLYYTGNRDKTKCWYCNGGLENWEEDDNPWEEHAKWYPNCEFVLQKKGPEYVHEIVSKYPNVRRSHDHRVQHHHISPNLRTTSSPFQPTSSTPARRNDTAPPIIDPRAEMLETQRKVENEMQTSAYVRQARGMGFREEVIRKTLQSEFILHNRSFSSLEELVEAVLSPSLNNGNLTHNSPAVSSLVGPPQFNSLSNHGPSSQELRNPALAIRHLEESRMCKMCRSRVACMVFLPCGHISCCVQCGEKSKYCPACRSYVREKIRSFMS